jgi:serine/threonine protein kinase
MRKPYSHVVDLWSLGVIVYILLSGFHPFDPQGDANEDRLQENIRNLRYDFSDPIFDRISGNAKHLIQSLLQLDPHRRLDSAGVLLHPWLQSHSRLWNRPTSPRGVMVPPSFEMPRDAGASAMPTESSTNCCVSSRVPTLHPPRIIRSGLR